MKRDARTCPGCGYDLRGRTLASDFCPECGAFLSFLDPDPATPTGVGPADSTAIARPPYILRRTHQADDRGILVRNASLSAALVERHLAAAARRAELWFGLGVAFLIVSFVGCVLFALVLQGHDVLPDLIFEHPVVSLGLLLGAHYAAYRLIVKNWLIDRAITRRVRITLRAEGHDVCLHCGWYVGEESEARTSRACPRCRRTRGKAA